MTFSPHFLLFLSFPENETRHIHPAYTWRKRLMKKSIWTNVRSELLMFYSTENNFMIYFTSGLYYYLLWLCIVNYIFPFISLFILVYVVSFVLWSNYVSDLVNVLSMKLCVFCKNINFKHVMCRYVFWDGIWIALRG